MSFQKTLPGRELERLLGLSAPTGIRSFRLRVFYEIKEWKRFPPPRLPKKANVNGRAALEVALLPFYVGLQGGDLDAQAP
jgi:hypothetical protein